MMRPLLSSLLGSLVFLSTPAAAQLCGPFQAGSATTIRSFVTPIAVGDFTNDGHLDVATYAYSTGVQVFPGNGDATFAAPLFSAATGGYVAHAADFDCDGNLDLFLHAYDKSLMSNELLLGQGNGYFVQVFQEEASAGSVHFGDIDGDGILDLLQTSSDEGLAVRLGNGDGTFNAGVAYPSGAYLAAVGDLNGDGRDDVVTQGPSTQVYVRLSEPGGTLGPVIAYQTGYEPHPAIGDFNLDGAPDLIIGIESDQPAALLANGDGSFEARPPQPGMGCRSLLVDLDRDGWSDVLQLRRVGTDSQWIAPMRRSEQETFALQGDHFVESLEDWALGDFDEDGYLDLLLSRTGAFGFSLLMGTPSGGFSDAAYYAATVASPLLITDIDSDGFTDVAIPNESLPVRIFWGLGNGLLAAPIDTSLVGIAVGAGDFNADGLNDLVASGSTGLYSALATAPRTFAPPLSAGQGNAGRLTVVDLDGDPNPDLIADASASTGNGDGTFTATESGLDCGYPCGVALAEFNGDGILDFAATGTVGIDVQLGNGDGTFAAPMSIAVGCSVQAIAAGDLTGDGNADIGYVSLECSSVGVLSGNGAGGFTSLPTIYLPFPRACSYGRFHGTQEGELVVATGYTPEGLPGEPSVFVVDVAGEVLSVIRQFHTAPAADILAAADLNGDNVDDLVTSQGLEGGPTGNVIAVHLSGTGMQIGPRALPPSTMSAPYSSQLTVHGGTPPFAFSLISGALPAGVTLDPTGLLAGTPAEEGVFDVTVAATDGALCSVTAAYELRVCASAIALAPAELPLFSLGEPTSAAIDATGGQAPHVITIVSGWLPGMRLSPDGEFIGVPASVSSRTIRVRATDALGCFGERDYVVAVADCAAPPQVTPPPPATVPQTVCVGGVEAATPATSAALAAFLAGDSAADACMAPMRLAPQLDGADVGPGTAFPVGTNAVTFRWTDDRGGVGSAIAVVTVELFFGDLDRSASRDAIDLVILANYLVGNVSPGVPPFTAPLGAADVNSNDEVTAADLVIFANALVGNIPCLPQ